MKDKMFRSFNICALSALLLFLANTAFSADTTDNISIIPTAGCNLVIDSAQDDINLKATSSTNWFAGVFKGFDITKPTTLTLDMYGTEGDVRKWEGLYPVYTYANHFDYNTYIYYAKNDDGYWVSSDPFLKGEAKLAGNGKTPIQTAIPELYAEEFLSEDGKYWSACGELKDTKINIGSNTFTITNQFNSPDAFIAMKYPYSYDYELAYIEKLKHANIPGVTVHEIGKSEKDHKLFVIQVSDPNATAEELKKRRVVLMYANEDGNEPDGSWVVNGAMNFLISGSDEAKKILKDVTFLFLPLLDPTGWSNSTYAAMTYDFKYEVNKPIRPEVLSYAKFIIDWCGEKENRLDVVVNLHNVECNEAPNVLCPILEGNQTEEIDNLNKFLLPRLEKLQEIKVGHGYWIVGGFSSNRLAGWSAYFWSNIQIAYEINSRYPENRLSLDGLNILGKSFVISLSEYFNSDGYERAFPLMEKYRYAQIKTRKESLPEYLSIESKFANQPNYNIEDMRNSRILNRGF